jgi:hypothetical protein
MEEIKSIQKLKGSDSYKVWSIQVTNALRAKGVFRYAQGIVPKPKEAQQELQYNWEDKDAIALNIITLTLSPDICSLTMYVKEKRVLRPYNARMMGAKDLICSLLRFECVNKVGTIGLDSGSVILRKRLGCE